MRKILKPGDMGRIFEAFQYDDSLPLDKLIAFLTDHAIPAVISPIHDKDKYCKYDDRVIEGLRNEGDPKKPHRHVLMLFSGKKSGRQVKEICDEIGLVFPAMFEDKCKRLRYLCHYDNPEKPFYNPMEVLTLAPINYLEEISKHTNHDQFISEMEIYIRENHEISFSRFKDYCREYNPDWYHAINSYARETILAYQRSLDYESKIEQKEKDYERDLLKKRNDDLKKALEDHIRRLEGELKSRGINPDSI